MFEILQNTDEIMLVPGFPHSYTNISVPLSDLQWVAVFGLIWCWLESGRGGTEDTQCDLSHSPDLWLSYINKVDQHHSALPPLSPSHLLAVNKNIAFLLCLAEDYGLSLVWCFIRCHIICLHKTLHILPRTFTKIPTMLWKQTELNTILS